MTNLNHDLLKFYKRILEVYANDGKTNITKIWKIEDMIELIEREIKAGENK